MMPAPAVQAFWYIPRLDHGEWVDFLIDTGASGTCLNGIYTLDLQRHMRRSTLSTSHGIGTSEYFYERAIIIFRDDNNELLSRTIQLGIQRIIRQHLSDPFALHCPCLLGRDIINGCTFGYDPRHNETTPIFH